MESCCKKVAHAQIEYQHAEKGSLESLIGVDPQDPETVKRLHGMLDEWLQAKRMPGDYRDHFIVFRKWPNSL